MILSYTENYVESYEMTEPYDSNLKKFLQEIGDNEINKLDDKLFIDCQIETDFSLEGGKIEWSNKVTEKIKKEFEEKYGRKEMMDVY